MRDVDSISELVSEIHDLATCKGWRNNEADKDKTGVQFAAYIALIHGEVSDVLEAHREVGWSGTERVNMVRYGGKETDTADKPIGVGAELADTLIRIFDMIDIWGIDIQYELERTFEFLWKRPYEPSLKP